MLFWLLYNLLKSIADSCDIELTGAICMQQSISTVSIVPGFNGKEVYSNVKNSSNNFECKENVCYSNSNKMLKKIVGFKRVDGSTCLLRMHRDYSRNQLNSIVYPFSYRDKIMKLNYTYNKQGLVSSMSIHDEQIASFDYTASGNLNQEILFTNSDKSFKQSYCYNSSDFLTRQEDCLYSKMVKLI